MSCINIYLNFNGTCEAAFNFYKSVFGGEFPYLGRFSEMPPQEGYTPNPEDADKIMHVSLPIGPNTVLMGSDTGGEWCGKFVQGTNFSISYSADNEADSHRIFHGLAEGGQITMPLAPTFWSPLFGMCTDKFGINWMVSFGKL